MPTELALRVANAINDKTIAPELRQLVTDLHTYIHRCDSAILRQEAQAATALSALIACRASLEQVSARYRPYVDPVCGPQDPAGVNGALGRAAGAIADASGQPLLDRQRELEEALIETSAQADWLWMELRNAGAPERFWKDQPQFVQEGYRGDARRKLAEKGLVTP